MEKTYLKAFAVEGGANLIGGGDVTPSQIEDIRDSDRPLFCADAGLFTAQQAGLPIAGVIGDLDSVGFVPVENVPIAHIADQNTTDFDKSLSLIAAKFILCYGFLGGRLDHSLATISSVARSDRNAFVINEMDFCAVCPPHLRLALPIGTRVSIYPILPTVARSQGLEYNLDGVDLSPIGVVSTSNTTKTAHIDIWIDSGVALVVLQRGELANALAQWPF